MGLKAALSAWPANQPSKPPASAQQHGLPKHDHHDLNATGTEGPHDGDLVLPLAH